MFYNDGDRRIGNYSNDKPIGKHSLLKNNGEIKIINF